MENTGFISKVEVQKISKEKNWDIKPCPFCGKSNELKVGHTTIDMSFNGGGPATARKKIWAACDYCGATSGHTVQDIIGNTEIVASAICKWNERKGE